MKRKNHINFPDHPLIKPYEFAGLKGRYLHWPAASSKAKRTFVLVYGQHATIERLLPIIEALSDFGDVYLADNPGFGGMDASYKIGRKPDLDLYAEHLAHFIEEYIPADRQLTLFGISYGFQMLVELLHDYPELNGRIEQIISFVGFVSHKDFQMPKRLRLPLMYVLANVGRTKPGAAIFDTVLSERLISGVYRLSKPIQPKFKTLSGEAARRYAREQATLWLVNDNLTHGVTAWEFFRRTDLTHYRLDAEAIHIGVPNDHLFNNSRVETELQTMFRKVTNLRLNLANHAPVDIETADEVRSLLPTDLKKIIGKSANKTAVRS